MSAAFGWFCPGDPATKLKAPCLHNYGLFPSCVQCRQVPELWQQHIQTLQDAPFRGGHGLAPASAAHGPGAAQAGPFLNIGRSSSTGIDALAEAAAAVLAARPDLLAGNTSSAAPPAAPGAQEQGSQLGGRDADAAPLPCKAGEDDMTAAPAPAAAQAITRAGVGAAQPDRKRGWEELTGGCHPGSRVPVDMGPPGVGLKRVCAVPAAGNFDIRLMAWLKLL